MMTVKITEKDSDRYEYITFPVNRYSFNDQLDRACIFGEYTAEIAELENETGLKNIKLSDEPTVDELNFLAKRLEEVCTDKCMALAYNAVISQYDSVSIAEAINCTYGLDTVPVYPCKNAEEYGAVVLENDFLEELNEIPDELYGLLDNEKVGKLMQEREGGVFIDGYYAIASSYEPQFVYDDVLPEPMDEWMFKFKVFAVPSEGCNFEEEKHIALTLPASREKIYETAYQLGEKNIEDCVIMDFESAIPSISDNILKDSADIHTLNEIACEISKMSRMEAAKCKAVFEREQPVNISEARDLITIMDCYEFDPSTIDLKDYGEKYLSEMLPPDFDRTVLSDGVTAYLGRNISEKNGSQMTEYGILSSAGGQIYSMIEAEQTQQQGQMMSI